MACRNFTLRTHWYGTHGFFFSFFSQFLAIPISGQEAVSLFLPLDDQPYRGILISCFVLIMVSRLCFLYTSTSYDIFFVDWEKPKGETYSL